MANILRKEGKAEHYLMFMLEVCYLDLNGPFNCGGINDPSIRRQYPPFNPKDGFLAPGIRSSHRKHYQQFRDIDR